MGYASTAAARRGVDINASMADYLDQLQDSLLHWARRAAAQHWLEPAQLTELERHSLASPAQLFTGTERPLVVGLFGGTGVGKSSLLNRLAREPIALASAERPTSRNITVYVHRSVTVSRLPDDFPMAHMRTTLHQRDDYRHVMWIDMPDFDSIESSHRQQVDHWLPHLDVIVYVVSPERYRDDDGWRLLQTHARGHAWLFVMNQWDRGDPVQLDDFRALLRHAGFADPMLFATDSRPTGEDRRDSTARGDTLADLEQAITHLADSQLIAQLGELGVLERARSLRELADSIRAGMGDASSLRRLVDTWPPHWHSVSETVSRAATWPIETLARHHALAQAPAQTSSLPGVLASLKPAFLTREEPAPSPATALPASRTDLLDDTLTERIDTGIDQFVQSAPQAGVPSRPLAHLLDEDRARRIAAARDQVDQAVAQSLAHPGTHWQRTLHRAAGLCAAFLPLLALCWIGLRIVVGYWRGGSDTSAYLGSDFAVHSALLLAVAWALPAFGQHRLKPSREAAATRGLTRGLENALDQLGEQVEERLSIAIDKRRQLDASYDALWQESAREAGPQLPEEARRLLFEPVS